MPIVSRAIDADGHLQPDGTKYVRERHIDNTGREHLRVYRADGAASQAQLDAAADAYASELAAMLADWEARSILEG